MPTTATVLMASAPTARLATATTMRPTLASAAMLRRTVPSTTSTSTADSRNAVQIQKRGGSPPRFFCVAPGSLEVQAKAGINLAVCRALGGEIGVERAYEQVLGHWLRGSSNCGGRARSVEHWPVTGGGAVHGQRRDRSLLSSSWRCALVVLTPLRCGRTGTGPAAQHRPGG